ncbi:hypothetical protein [Reyranella sp.]|uniref:hypothetical protein n=1 Tax=Reyranella sp. TaxID=1929291 RepID=UPI003D0F8608
MLATMHFIALRGMRRAGIAKAQEPMNAMRDPRRISAFRYGDDLAADRRDSARLSVARSEADST